ncbi:hypothetical protein LUZ60_004780 [Juncus effusus]|nr:hypothetical protein LUZ60_004780 [Juncus effusus]
MAAPLLHASPFPSNSKRLPLFTRYTRKTHALKSHSPPNTRFERKNLSTEEALHEFDQLLRTEKARPKPSVYPFNSLLKSICLSDYQENGYVTVISLFNRMIQECGVYPDEHTYVTLIHYCCRVKQTDLAFVFFGRFVKYGFRADIPTMNLLVRGLCVNKRVSEAVDMVFDKMPKMGCKPDLVSYNTIIS